MIYKELPPLTLLKELLKYNSITGKLTWNVREERHIKNIPCATWNKRYAYTEAGYTSKSDGYIYVEIYKETFLSHRIIWKIVYEEEPIEIDHKDGIRNNNILTNLRNVTHPENSKNITLPTSNTSGHIGVYRHSRKFRWCAQIKVNQRAIHLGSFYYLEDAIKARKEAEIKYNFHQNHGKVQNQT